MAISPKFASVRRKLMARNTAVHQKNILSVDGAFEGRFRIRSETWNEALWDPESTLYQAMSARILEDLQKIYSGDDINVSIFGFEPGSVIVKFR